MWGYSLNIYFAGVSRKFKCLLSYMSVMNAYVCEWLTCKWGDPVGDQMNKYKYKYKNCDACKLLVTERIFRLTWPQL